VTPPHASAARIPSFGWFNGKIVPFDECVVHVRTQGAFWGANVFEGLRGYWLPDEQQLTIFRLDDHLQRLRRSMKSLHMPTTYSDDDIRRACVELLRVNKFQEDVHLCVVAYFGFGHNFDPLGYTEDTGLHVTSTPAPRSRGYSDGIRASISSWRRISDDSMPPRIKTGANYHNSRLAHHEAIRNGFDTTFLLNQRGSVSEAPGSCIAMVRDNRIVTPPGTSGVLEGITVATIEQLALERRGWQLERREIDRTELYAADEVFVCGTLAEIQPVVQIDRLPVGGGVPGPVTRTLQQLYEAAVRGEPEYREWSTPVSLGLRPAAA
jgi:branched-chain amino acid aminotransferase